MKQSGLRIVVVAALMAAALLGYGAELKSETNQAFDGYTVLAEKQLREGPFLYSDAHAEAQAAARRGETFVAEQKAAEYVVPGGLMHDWLGVSFFPGATIAGLRAQMQDYDNYKTVYNPDVIDSRLMARNGNAYKAYLKLENKQFVKLIYDSEYAVEFSAPATDRMEIISRSTRKEHEGGDEGFLWRVNSYWRFEQAPDGVYVQCRVISLSRGLPIGIGWLRGPLERFPRESMVRTMEATRRAATCGGANCSSRSR